MVAMVCQGPNCGKTFEAKRKTAVYCCNGCSVRASRAGQLGKPTPADGAVRKPRVGSAMLRSTRTELAAAGRVGSSAGQRALLLAKRLDVSGQETGAAVAALCREHASAMDKALAAGAATDPVQQLQDEVGTRRRERAKSAGAARVHPPARI